MTYHDMLHKNLWVSQDHILRYLVSNFLRFNHVRQLQPHHHQRTSQMKAWNNQKMFSLVNMAMVNHSLFIFFARLTMFIVKLDRKTSALASAFGSKIHGNRNGTNTHAHNRCHIPNGRDRSICIKYIYIYIYIYFIYILMWNYIGNICTLYFIQGRYYLDVLDIYKTFIVKGPLILLYLVI